MKSIRLAAFVIAIAAAAMSIGSAAAGTSTSVPTVDLSTDQAVMSYLTSLGIDPTGVVIQRGQLNYSGPRCPGTGWTCTTATKVVQVAQPGGQNQVACGAGTNVIPDSYMTTALTQDQINQLVAASSLALPFSSCIAVQAGGAQTNSARCVMRDTTDAPDLQDCTIIQPDGVDDDPTASNRAFVLETIDSNTGPTQAGAQQAKISQNAIGAAKNFAHVIQYIKQSTKIADVQTQQGDQLTCTVQASQAGDEFSQVNQSLEQKERAQASTSQNQNTGFEGKDCAPTALDTSAANTFALVRQNSVSGALESHVNQSHNLDARGSGAVTLNQTQGVPPPAGGLQGKVFQNSNGLAKSFGLQNEDQNLTGNSPTITQKQFGPLTCCSTQTDNPKDNVGIDQMSAQRAVVSSSPMNDLVPAVANPSALQETLLEGDFDTTGAGQITHKANQNEGSDTAYCPTKGGGGGDEITTLDGSNTCSLTTFGLNGVFFAEFPPPLCDPPYTFFDPTTGECSGID